eukprot:m.86313 g.86313  ORF g.86313 m.86313 type:complete len:536 (+) comp13054_c0_seq1:137-1744(+)
MMGLSKNRSSSRSKKGKSLRKNSSTASLDETQGLALRAPSKKLRSVFKLPADKPEDPLEGLSEAELQRVAEMQEKLKDQPWTNGKPVSDSLVVRCLASRKWEVDRALSILENYLTILAPAINPDSLSAADVLPELKTGIFQLTGTRDTEGAALLMYTGQKQAEQDLGEIDVLKLSLYLAHVATKDKTTLRNGFTLVLSDCTGTWREAHLRNVVVETLQNRYPARIGNVLIVADSWLRKLWLSIAKPLMKRKLKAKIQIVRNNVDLEKYIANEQLPASLGGTHKYSHIEWIRAQLAAEGMVDPQVAEKNEDPLVSSRDSAAEQLLLFTAAELKAAREAVAHCKAYTSPQALQISSATRPEKNCATESTEAVVTPQKPVRSSTSRPDIARKAQEAFKTRTIISSSTISDVDENEQRGEPTGAVKVRDIIAGVDSGSQSQVNATRPLKEIIPPEQKKKQNPEKSMKKTKSSSNTKADKTAGTNLNKAPSSAKKHRNKVASPSADEYKAQRQLAAKRVRETLQRAEARQSPERVKPFRT